MSDSPDHDLLPTLLRLHREVLDDPELTAADNFYACGGNSLLGIALTRRVRSALGVTVSAKAVLTAPSIGHLADTLEAGSTSDVVR